MCSGFVKKPACCKADAKAPRAGCLHKWQSLVLRSRIRYKQLDFRSTARSATGFFCSSKHILLVAPHSPSKTPFSIFATSYTLQTPHNPCKAGSLLVELQSKFCSQKLAPLDCSELQVLVLAASASFLLTRESTSIGVLSFDHASSHAAAANNVTPPRLLNYQSEVGMCPAKLPLICERRKHHPQKPSGSPIFLLFAYPVHRDTFSSHYHRT